MTVPSKAQVKNALAVTNHYNNMNTDNYNNTDSVDKRKIINEI